MAVYFVLCFMRARALIKKAWQFILFYVLHCTPRTEPRSVSMFCAFDYCSGVRSWAYEYFGGV